MIIKKKKKSPLLIMENFLKFFSNNDNQQNIKSSGSHVSSHEIKFFKKTYDRYPQHYDYDSQKFSNVVDKLHFENELKILKLLEEYDISPKIIDSHERTLYLSDCGQELTKDNLPKDWKEQLLKIHQVLKSHFLYHNDIKSNNFTVKNHKLYLIDFGWSSFYKPEYPYWNLTEKIINESISIEDIFHQVFNLSMKNMGEIFVRNNNQINYTLKYLMK